MLLVIDSNEYIFAFGPFKEAAAKTLLDKAVNTPGTHNIRIPRTIFEEVKRNLSAQAFQEFNTLITKLTSVDEDIVVPFELGIKYESMGLKPADSFIAAYTEWTGADVLVTENRHFLGIRKDLPFKVVKAEDSLEFLDKK